MPPTPVKDVEGVPFRNSSPPNFSVWLLSTLVKLAFAEGFSQFAYEIATFGLILLGLAWEIKDEHLDFKNVVKDSMKRILHLAKQKISTKGMVIEEKEEEL